MISMILYMRAIVLLMVLFSTACGTVNSSGGRGTQTILVGSTPGDEVIKSLLSIDAEKQIDFIRWNLILSDDSERKYALDINYGEAQPNTLGFKSGGERLTLDGTYMVAKGERGEIFGLKNGPTTILLLKLNDDLFHLLTPQKSLMIGNGGWSYTLNRKGQAKGSSTAVPALVASVPNETGAETTFDGRTPCTEFVKLYDWSIEGDCFKLKWRLILRRDPIGKPAGYTIYRTQHRQSAIKGIWVVQKGIPANPDAVIYRLDPDKPSESISLLIGDENVLFFLDKEYRLLTGNDDHSFTLNRRQP